MVRQIKLPALRSPLGFEAFQMFYSRLETQHTTAAGGDTQEMAIELMARTAKSATAPRAILSQSRAAGTADLTGVNVSLAFISQLSDLDGAWTGVQASFLGSAAENVPAAADAAKCTLLRSDPVETYPVDKADGRDVPLLALRTFLAGSAVNLAISGASGVDLSNWASRPGMRVRQRQHNTAGDQRAAATWGTTSTGVSKGLMVGAGFTHDTPVANVTGVGDSILTGDGAVTYSAESFGLLACEECNTRTRKTQFVFSNMGWSGQASDAYLLRFRKMLAYLYVPDISVINVLSPNETVGQEPPLTDTIIAHARYNVGRHLAYCAQYGVVPVLLTSFPSPWHTGWGATDALRRAFNAEILEYANLGRAWVVDAGAAVAGPIVDGQETYAPGMSDDTIHLSDLGKATVAALLADTLFEIAGEG